MQKNRGLLICTTTLMFLTACHSASDSPLARAAATLAKTEAPHDAQWVQLDSSDAAVQECAIKFPDADQPWTARIGLKPGQYAIHARIQQDGASGSWSSGEVWSDAKTDDGKDALDESTLKARLHDCATHVMSIGLLESHLGPDNAVVTGLRTLEKQDIEKAKALRKSAQSGS
ncbi:hypothetical protein KNO81_16640 [Paraburkholderia sediminicola]|nr:hypothetical protein [Paraburkholderia sediminicola]